MEKLNKNELTAIQLSERSGELKLKIVEDRIIISGQAVTTLKGVLLSRNHDSLIYRGG